MSVTALASLREDMHRLVDEKRRAGIVYGVLHKGDIVDIDSYGLKDVQRGSPMATETIFRIFSMTRAISTAAFLTLFDQGRIDLTDPVADYLPEFKSTPVIRSVDGDQVILEEQASPLTIQHLLTYTSGLGYAFNWPASFGFKMSDVLDLDRPTRQGVKTLAKMPLLRQPGAKWQYGFSGDVLGAVAEVAAGAPLDRFLSETLLGPLGMHDTAFCFGPDKAGRLSRAYGPGDAGPLSDVTALWQPEYGTFDKPIQFFSAGGGLASTVPDMLRFCQMLLNEGRLDGVRHLRPKTVRMMLTPQTTPEQGLTFWYDPDASPVFKGKRWGFGLAVAEPPTPLAGEIAGWGGLMNTVFFLDSRNDLAAVAMSQYVGPDEAVLGQILQKGVLAALPTA
jgi:CubicO group peptidase (beta-lactamase class C family)